MSRIYTRCGDKGMTGLADGRRVDKSSKRIEAIGQIDELNSILGMLIEGGISDEIRQHLSRIQHQLFDIGGELAVPEGKARIGADQVIVLEQLLDQYNMRLPKLKNFILPGGGRAASLCHFARSICRRAERSLVDLNQAEALNPEILCYTNRLSDLLFVFARTANAELGNQETLWEGGTTP